MTGANNDNEKTMKGGVTIEKINNIDIAYFHDGSTFCRM